MMTVENLEIRNMRLLDGRNTVDDVTYSDYDRVHIYQMPRSEFKALGEPTYIVISVRAETFSEGTQ